MSSLSGLIFNIQRFSVNDGPGIRTTVFFKGCPLNCVWCHNPESRQKFPEKFNTNPYKNFNNLFGSNNGVIGQNISTDSIMTVIEKDLMFYEESKGGVTFSGGEPLMQVEFLLEMLQKCKKKDIHTAVDTSGYTAFNDFLKILPFTDLFLFDLKIIDDIEHLKFTGVSNEIILNNLRELSNSGKDLIIRIPLIPGITDTERNLNDIINFIAQLKTNAKISLLPYNEMTAGKYQNLGIDFKLKNVLSQSPEFLDGIVNKFHTQGYEVKLRG